MAHSALIEPLRRWDPAQVGGYVLIGRLGAGAMGQVYLGRSAAGRLVAVKTIKVEFADESDFRTRFSQEIAAARRVSGAFTAAVVAADPEADVPWLATAYVPAPSLSALVRACGPMSVPAVRWLAAGCAEALESIHGTGLVHRDLKPSNVLVSPDGPRVIDFGIARAAERIQLTLTRGAVGTPAFMAPEQARDSRQATAASDVYSLGATMLMAATGHGPYRGETVMDVLAQLATAPPDLSGLPADLADVVTACLEPDPARRPTAASVLAQLTEGNQDDQSFDLGPELLSGPARAMIADYRRALRPLAQPDADADGDDTLGSLPALGSHWGPDPDPAPGSRSAAGPHSASGPEQDPGLRPADGTPAGVPGGADNPNSPGGPRRRASRRRGRALAILGVSVTAIALLAAGIALGGYLAGGRANAGGGRTPGTAGGTSGSPASGITAGRSSGAVPGATGSPPPGPAGPPGLGPPPPPPPNVRAQALATGKPAVALIQPFGDTHTTFVVMGAGFPAGARITIRLVGAGVSAGHTTADDSGAFNFAINQGHEFFRGWLPPGTYRVEVTAPGGFRKTASIIVAPATT